MLECIAGVPQWLCVVVWVIFFAPALIPLGLLVAMLIDLWNGYSPSDWGRGIKRMRFDN